MFEEKSGYFESKMRKPHFYTYKTPSPWPNHAGSRVHSSLPLPKYSSQIQQNRAKITQPTFRVYKNVY